MKDFVHLHVHSEYSLLDGYAPTKGIAARAVELGMDSIALTDHGVMYGVLEFYDAAKKANIKPIIGVESYMAPSAHNDKSARAVDGKGHYYHQLLIARNEVGYRNLVKLTTRAHLDGFHYKPRIDRALLEQHAEGLIATSSCLAGEIPQHILQKQTETAYKIAAEYKDIFGPENFYLELQLHANTPELETVNDELVRMSKQLGIPLIATNDTHFIRREDIETHNHILAMGYNTTVRELCSKNRNFDDSYHIMSGEEMWQRFKHYGAEALENTRRIAERCDLDLEFGRVQLPAFEIPAGHDASSFLRLVCEEGLMKRFNGKPPAEYLPRLDYELDVIDQTGFPDYMLIVWDYVKFARARSIPCLPRGSAGASLILYCLYITDVDPVANKLLFERFLSPERLEMPDIDIDFADSRRHEVIEYIADKYGHDNTAQIITYGTLGAKAALRDVGRVRDIPLSEVDRVAKLIPSIPVGITIEKALDKVAELRQIYEADGALREVIDHAKKVEGRMKSVGTHACGVVVSRNPLDEIVPLQRVARDESAVMAAYEGPTLAKVGLLKMDILGLTNLSVVAETLNYIEQTTGQRIELADIPLTDHKTFESLSNGDTVNVFQLESAGMTRYLKELKPTRVQDLYAMVALYRPGPLEQIPNYIRNKNNPEKIDYLHPILKPILEDTYGVIVYQEQIMQLLQAIAGYTLGRAYVVLKAIGKKKRDLMAQEEPRFKEGCIKSGLTQEEADTLWDLIQPFAGYSFNRPHSTLYGLLSYQTAYLKVNYSTEYMAAVLSAAAGDTDEVAKSLAECYRLGVQVLRIDINKSGMGFTIEELSSHEHGTGSDGQVRTKGIRFGLSAIKNVGSGPVEAIIAARDAGGPFTSLEDFCSRVERQALSKRVLESLIKAGAMDHDKTTGRLPGTRRQKLEILDQAISAGIETQKAREAGQSSMFDDIFGGDATDNSPGISAIPMPILNETSEQKREELAWEKELLGMYISEHPLTQALQGADLTGITRLSEIVQESIGQTLTFVGMVNNSRRIMTKKGDAMLVASLEDMESEIEMVAFPRVFERHAQLLVDDTVLLVKAKVDNRRDTLQLIVEACEQLVYTDASTEDATPDTEAMVQPEMDMEHLEAENSGPPHNTTPEPHTTATGQHLNGAEHTQSTPGDNSATETQHAADTPDQPAVNGNGEQGDSPPEAPAHDAAPAVIKGRRKISLSQKPAANGAHSNGHSNGNGNGTEAHTEYRTGQHENGSMRKLRLYLPRTRDFDEDVRCMQDIDEMLRSYRGSDQIIIYLPNSIGLVALRPHYTVQVTAQLIESLSQMLGAERVVVDE